VPSGPRRSTNCVASTAVWVTRTQPSLPARSVHSWPAWPHEYAPGSTSGGGSVHDSTTVASPSRAGMSLYLAARAA